MEEINDQKIFRYLDGLRESGMCNMFESPQHLAKEFNLSFSEACSKFEAWAIEKGGWTWSVLGEES